MRAISVLKVLIFTYLFTGLLLLLLSLGLYKFNLTERQVGIGIYAVYFLSGVFGGFLIGKTAKKKKFLWGIVIGICYFAILAAVSFGVNHSLTAGLPTVFAILALCGAGGMFGGMIS